MPSGLYATKQIPMHPSLSIVGAALEDKALGDYPKALSAIILSYLNHTLYAAVSCSAESKAGSLIVSGDVSKVSTNAMLELVGHAKLYISYSVALASLSQAGTKSGAPTALLCVLEIENIQPKEEVTKVETGKMLGRNFAGEVFRVGVLDAEAPKTLSAPLEPVIAESRMPEFGSPSS